MTDDSSSDMISLSQPVPYRMLARTDSYNSYSDKRDVPKHRSRHSKHVRTAWSCDTGTQPT